MKLSLNGALGWLLRRLSWFSQLGRSRVSFATDGFLSPTIDRFRTSMRKVPTYRQWFEFAEDLNRLGIDMQRDRDIPRNDNQKLTIAALFVRAHQSFQAALTLAERGMLGDARVVLRSAVEGAIALNALANDIGFLDQLTDAHYFNQRKIARLTLGSADYRSHYAPDQIAAMEATIKEVDAIDGERLARGQKKLADVTWADVAMKHCQDLYDLLYRQLSGDGTNTNINSMHRHMEYDSQGLFSGFKVGPSVSDMVEVLKAACLMFLWAADPFARANAEEFRPRIEAGVQRFGSMPFDEPPGVSVRQNFEQGG
ncbi:MAG: DUF5677 domain-containing protein [Reyranellales bacterium]